MNLLKTSFYTSISTAVTFICGFIVAKVVAVKIGPAGIAMVGQFQNTMAIFTMLGTGAINLGVVKYLSEDTNKEIQQKILNTSISIVLIASVVVSVFVLVSANWLSTIAFHTSDYWLVYVFFGSFLFFTSVNTLFTSVFNGLKEIQKLTFSNIIFSVAGIMFTIVLAYGFGVKGVLVATNATALVVFGFNWFLFRKIPKLSLRISFKNWDKNLLKKLFAYSLMSALSAFVIPIMQLIVRNKIITSFSPIEAGYWQGVTKISDYYLTFIITVLSVYYLPRLSEIRSKAELRQEIFNGYKIILPAVGALALAIGFFKHYIILILFSKEFLPMEPLFTFQLVGDFIKISAWLLGYLMLAKAMVKTFLLTEIIFSATYVMWSILFINRFGLIGATYAFALNYFIYLLVVAILMRKQIF